MHRFRLTCHIQRHGGLYARWIAPCTSPGFRKVLRLSRSRKTRTGTPWVHTHTQRPFATHHAPCLHQSLCVNDIRMSDRDRLGLKLFWACWGGRTAEAKGLIEEGAPVDWQRPGSGEAPLHQASRNGHTEIVMLLLEKKCDLNITDDRGDTPLIHAAFRNKMDTVRALVEAGCDITAELAKKKGRDAIAEYLTTVRFQPSARNESGELYKEHGRAERAATRDLVDIAGFDRDMMGLLDQFCTGKR